MPRSCRGARSAFWQCCVASEVQQGVTGTRWSVQLLSVLARVGRRLFGSVVSSVGDGCLAAE